jgi:hypothetical protein
MLPRVIKVYVHTIFKHDRDLLLDLLVGQPSCQRGNDDLLGYDED